MGGFFLTQLGMVVSEDAITLPEEPITDYGEYSIQITVSFIIIIIIIILCDEFISETIYFIWVSHRIQAINKF